MAKPPAFDLAGLIKAVKLKDHNCAILLGKDGPVIAADPRKSTDILFKQAKASGGGPKGITGRMSVNGGILTVTCDADPPNMMLKELKKMLTDAKLQMRVSLVGPAGAVSEPDSAPAPGPDPARQEQKKRARADLEKAAAGLREIEAELAALDSEFSRLEALA